MVKDYRDQVFTTKQQLMDFWGITEEEYRHDAAIMRSKKGKECSGLATCKNIIAFNEGKLFARQEKYADIDNVLDQIVSFGITYPSYRNVAYLPKRVAKGILVFILAKAFGYFLNYDDINHRELAKVPKASNVYSMLPAEFSTFFKTLDFTKMADRYSRGEADIFKAAFPVPTSVSVTTFPFRYKYENYLFKDRRSLLCFLKKCGVPVNFDIAEVYSMDSSRCTAVLAGTVKAYHIDEIPEEVFLDIKRKLFYNDEDWRDVAIDTNEDFDFYECCADSVSEEDVLFNTYETPAEFCGSVDKVVEESSDVEESTTSDTFDGSRHYCLGLDNTIFSSITDFEKVYNKPISVIYERVSEGYTLEEAVQDGYFANKCDDGHFDFPGGVEIDGICFESLSSFCTMLGIPCCVVLTRLRRGVANTVMDAVRIPTADRDVKSVLFKAFVEAHERLKVEV